METTIKLIGTRKEINEVLDKITMNRNHGEDLDYKIIKEEKEDDNKQFEANQ